MADPVLRGSKAIGEALGCSSRTVQRLARKGVLPAWKVGDRSSPLTITRKQIAAIKRGQKVEEI